MPQEQSPIDEASPVRSLRSMSLTGRLLLAIAILSIGVVISIQVVAWDVQQRWRQQHNQAYQNIFRGVFAGAEETGLFEDLLYSEGWDSDFRRLRSLLAIRPDSELFSDLIIVNDRDAADGYVELNLMGASQRGASFPRAEIYEGLATALTERSLVPAGGGYCVPLTSGDRAVGAVWYSLAIPPPPPPMPTGFVLVVILAGFTLLVLLTYVIVSRTLVQPMAQLSVFADRLGRGDYDVRIPRLSGAHEIARLAEVFNSMADKVEGHAGELQREVDAAVTEAQRKERALVVSSRLASIGTLAAGIAHEINNPIGGMQNAVHRLLQDPDRSDRDRRYLSLVQEGLERIGHIARRVLDFSPRNVEGEPFAIVSAAQAALGLVDHRLLRSNARIEIEAEPDLPNVLGDRHELQQVFLNLFLNSLDAFDEGAGSRITVRARAEGERVIVDVEDDGPGAPPEILDRVLDPFFSNKGRPDASGLGMFICYSIVDSHGGTLTLDSCPGEGFRVRLNLPAVRG